MRAMANPIKMNAIERQCVALSHLGVASGTTTRQSDSSNSSDDGEAKKHRKIYIYICGMECHG